MATFFDDVFKGTKDFFKKSFNYDNKVEVKAAGAGGVSFKAEGGLNAKRAAFASLTAERKQGAVQVDKVSVGTDAKIVGEFSFPDLVPGAKATFKVEDGTRTSSANTSAVFGVQGKAHVGADAGVKVDFDAVGGALNANALINYDGVLAGGKVAVDTGLGNGEGKGVAVKGYDAVVGYQAGGNTFGVQVENKLSKATAFFFSGGNKDFTVTGQASFGLKADAAKNIDVAFGGKYAVDGATVYGAVNQNAVVQVGYETSVGRSSSLGVYGEVHALDIDSDNHRMGLNLKIKA
jgi:ketosteroid isomerase-like protein